MDPAAFSIVPLDGPFEVEEVLPSLPGDIEVILTAPSGKKVRFTRVGDRHPHLLFEVSIMRLVGELGFGPKVLGCNHGRGDIAVEYLPAPDPPLEFDDKLAVMKLLRVIHDRRDQLWTKEKELLPFSLIRSRGEGLKKRITWLPYKYTKALRLTISILARLATRIIDRDLVCHGGLASERVSIVKGDVVVTGWEKAEAGEPLFDIALYSTGMKYRERTDLLEAYLGKRPTGKDHMIIEMMDLCILILIATTMFSRAHTLIVKGEEGFSIESLNAKKTEEVLVPFDQTSGKDTSARAYQYRGLCAAHEFCKRFWLLPDGSV